MTHATARQLMIDAAERIVAERGMPAMTLRKVQEAAGQANRTAAQYHFGSREGLISAILEDRMGPVDRARRELLDKLDTAESEPTVRQLTDALVRPLADNTVGRPGSRYARFLAQVVADPSLAEIARNHVNAGSVNDVIKRLEIAAGGGPVGRAKVEHVVILASFALARYEGSGEVSDRVVDTLVDSCVAVLTGPRE
ncbi:TetR/AcrR family transcriptional regulator [Rhodococcus opacus]|uniref:TetR/AcrR family transcriptional regulator n=1 Tax=Rhodococcus opacus TaxID=37919 RepID=UPI0027DF3661|nr:TetR family transcriptional regulator [Rhodococcus opacus]